MLPLIDLTIFVTLLLVCLLVGFYYSEGKQSLEEYFLARKKFRWWAIGFVAFASNSAFSVYIDIGGKAYREGLNAFNFELTGIVCCVIMSYFFSKVYYQNKIYTTAEFIELRFNRQLAFITSFFLIFMYITTRISVILICCSILLSHFFDLDIYTFSLFMVSFCGVYSVLGGQKSIFYNSIIMGIFLLVGGFILTFIFGLEFSKITGPSIPESYFHLISPNSQNGFNISQVTLALPIIGIWYHCANQELVQNYFAAKSSEEFQAGALFHGYLKLLIFPLVILPGILAYALYPNINSQEIFPVFISQHVPTILKGIVLFGLIGSGLVGISACFNACSTIFTFNFYRIIYPNANSFALINIGKISTIVVTILSMTWLVFLQSLEKELIVYVFSVLTYFTPPFAVIFLTGIFWKRCTNKAATITLITGLTLGLIKFIIFIIHDKSKFDTFWLAQLAEFNFFDFCTILFFVNLLMIITISLADQSDKSKNIDHLIFKLPSFKNIFRFNLETKLFYSSIFLILSIITIYIIWN